METLGPAELLIILAIILLVFGSSKLPKLARSLGQASNELKKGLRGEPDETPEDEHTPSGPTPGGAAAEQPPPGTPDLDGTGASEA